VADSVRKWMTPDVRSVVPSAMAEELIEILSSAHVSSVPVVERGVVVGVVSRTDVVRTLALEQSLADWMLDSIAEDEDAARASQLAEFVGRRLEARSVAQLMNASPVTIPVEASMSDAARTLVDHGIHHAPVVDGDRLVGVVSTFDLARWVAAGAA
jgi:CBS domain-containing protein